MKRWLPSLVLSAALLTTVTVAPADASPRHGSGLTAHQQAVLLRGGEVAVAGIGEPNRFFLHLGKLGIKVVPHPFPDHHAFTAQELAFGDEAPVLMTEKDAVKLRRAARANWWVLPVTAEVDAAFGEWLTRRLDGCRRSKAA